MLTQFSPKTKYAFFFIVLISVLVSCTELIDSSDYELEKIKATPTLSIPLAYGNLGIDDLLDDTDEEFIKIYPDGLVYLFYEETLTTKDIRDMLRFPNKGFDETFPLLPATLLPRNSETTYATVNVDEDFGFAPEKLTEIKLKTGTRLELAIDYSPEDPGVFEIELELPGFTLNGVPLKRRASGGSPISVDLGGYVAMMDNNTFPVKVSLIEKAHNSTVVIDELTTATLSFDFKSIDFEYVKGFFGERTPTRVPTLTIDISAFGNSLGEAQVSFADPKLSLEITSEYGIPATIDFNPFEVRKQNASPMPILFATPTPIQLLAPAAPGGEAKTDIQFSNTGQIFDYAPEEFYYQFQMHINQGLTSGVNFCADTSKIKVKFTAEVPIYGKASGIVMADTFDIDLGDAKESDIESATLRSKAVNELPLEAKLQIYLADENSSIIDSIFTSGLTSIIKASTVNASGDLTQAGVAEENIHLSEDKLQKLFAARKLIVRMRMATSTDAGGSQVHVKFKSQYKINLKLGLDAKLNLEVDL